MLNAIKQVCQEYYDHLPADGLKAAGLSAAISLVTSVTIICFSTGKNEMPKDLSRMGIATGVAFLASTIHALTTPVFNYLFDNPNDDFNGFEQFVRALFDITLVHLLVNHTTAYKINLITSTNFQGGNFIILPHTIFKANFDMMIRFFRFIGIPSAAIDIHRIATGTLNIDFTKNSSPIYVTA